MDLWSRAFRSAFVTIAMVTHFGEFALAHGLGGKSVPTPPLRAYLDEAQALARELPNGLGVRGVLDQFKLWPLNSPLIVCFNNGDRALRDVFVQTGRRWSPGTSLKLDFGAAPGYRACSGSPNAQIRVSFNPADGHWSYLGTDALKYKSTTLNIGYSEIPTDPVARRRMEGIILHEFGHAIGFEHEHQSPASKCDEEFDWPKVYNLARTQWGWVLTDGSVDKKTVDFNLRALTAVERLKTTPYDRESIMHYFFEPELFKRGKNSRCFVGHNDVLSYTDIAVAGAAYPPTVALQDEQLQKRANVASAALALMKLTRSQLSQVGGALGQVLGIAQRKTSLDFNLARASGGVLTRGSVDFLPCGEVAQTSSNPTMTVACEVATDASALLVAVEPNELRRRP